MIEFGQGDEIAFEARFDTLAGAQHRHARRVEARIREQAAADVAQPLDSLPDEVATHGDLHEREEIEKSFHVH